MSSRGKGKKPLGNEGKAPDAKEDPVILKGDESGEPETLDEGKAPDAKEDPVILNYDEPNESEMTPEGCFYVYPDGCPVMQLQTIDISGTSMMTTYYLIEAVLQERTCSLAVALAKNTYRHGLQDRLKDWTASATAGIAAGMVIDPIVGVVVAVVGGLARNAIEVFRLRRGRRKEITAGTSKAGAEIRTLHEQFGELPTKIDLCGKLPNLPEFNNEWVRLAHRLVRLTLGYNVRADVVNRIRYELARNKMPGEKAAALATTADGMTKMLLKVRSRLQEVSKILEELEPADFKDLRKLEEHDDRLLTNDLLGEDRGEAATLLWLDAPYERILINEAPRIHETDCAVCEGRAEFDEELSLERRFVRLKEKLIREREQLKAELAALVAQTESLPSQERPAAEDRLESIRARLREISSFLDVNVDTDVEE